MDEYWEDVEQGAGGVVLEDGRKHTADIVVAADGLRTKSNTIVKGALQELKKSGRAIYRAAFPLEHALQDPLVKERRGFNSDHPPIWELWIGSHAIVSFTHDVAFWAFIHSHDETARENWVPNVDPAEVVKIMERDTVVHPEAYAYDKFVEAFHHVVSNGKVELDSTNVPRGHKYKPWTMGEVLQQIADGKSLEQLQQGDWS